MSPAYITGEAGPVFGGLNCGFHECDASEVGNVSPSCLTWNHSLYYTSSRPPYPDRRFPFVCPQGLCVPFLDSRER